MGKFCYIDGVFVETEKAALGLPSLLRAGEGLFETFRTWNGKLFRWQRHAARLFSSAQGVSLKLSLCAADLEDAVRRLVATNDTPDARVRITVFPAAEGDSPIVAIHATELHEPAASPVRIAFAGRASAPAPSAARHKSMSRLQFRLARLRAEMVGADEALLQDASGAVTEATVANVFFIFQGELLTPGLDCGLLHGVTREAVIEMARDLGMHMKEERITVERGLEAQECFLTNAVRGVYPVSALGSRTMTAPGPVTLRISEAYRKLVEREAV